MVLVPAGPFTMGSESGSPDEKPARTLTLPAFYIDRTEVTNEQYARFVQATGHAAPPDWPGRAPDPKKLRLPVVNVSWYDASAYARWAGRRLPTEAEWEKAARGPDGRLLPWGAQWDDRKANVEGKSGDLPLKPVGSYPEGAAPCGALDMVGNAWEWTADWYDRYPGNPVPSVHYGEKYRVIKGGGCLNFYNSPPLNEKSAALRARIQPFGRYDALGFRCVADAAGPRRVAPAAQPPSEREKPAPPKVETPAEVAARYRNGVPLRIEGAAPEAGVVTFGLPFPQGIVRDLSRLRAECPLQARPVAQWKDGSVRWALVDVPAGRSRLTLRWDGAGSAPVPADRVTVHEDEESVIVEASRVRLQIHRLEPRWLTLESRGGGDRLDGPLADVLATETTGARVPLRMQTPAHVTVEDHGPLRARVRVEGWLVDEAEKPVLRYRCRLDVRQGSPVVGFVHTFTHLSPRKMLLIRRYTLGFRSPVRAQEDVYFGGDHAAIPRRVAPGAAGAYLEQTSPTSYRVTGVRGAVSLGTRASGWLRCGRGGGTLLAVKHFWQQYPAALNRTADDLSVSLWAGPDAFEADQGLSKTHELALGVGVPTMDAAPRFADETQRRLEHRPFAVAPADWYCATRGLGVLAPYSLSKYPQYETEVEAAADLEARSRPFGMRNWGDNYFGGPYKGINSFQNLEYDVPYNHFMQFARTGARKYLDTGILQARHQGDIDFKHDDGPQWKHSPRHTTTEAELGHVFCRGLVASTWLTGDPEGLENAKLLGDWLIKVVANPRSQGNERQIGWSLYALTGIYEATWDPRYLAAMKAQVDRLLAGQDPLGRFSIRWDNRISFFYGITLSGFVKYYEVTGDERIADSIARIVRRIEGFYPEYGGRTLEGLAWLYTRTGDPEVRLTARRTWESTMVWRPFEIGGMTIFTTRFLPSVETLGLACPPEWRIPETGPVEDGMRRHHY
ncbi:MAG TPA: SUMF1/EgtB/PvdO family nonheme iron enzyme, partial [Armatimonadota bacterium]|nr:SUMF1/EgtB/PvdO family nonheme iron enzyme [Armatimonadota bacterium]